MKVKVYNAMNQRAYYCLGGSLVEGKEVGTRVMYWTRV
jgi:hypothetical protein